MGFWSRKSKPEAGESAVDSGVVAVTSAPAHAPTPLSVPADPATSAHPGVRHLTQTTPSDAVVPGDGQRGVGPEAVVEATTPRDDPSTSTEPIPDVNTTAATVPDPHLAPPADPAAVRQEQQPLASPSTTPPPGPTGVPVTSSPAGFPSPMPAPDAITPAEVTSPTPVVPPAAATTTPPQAPGASAAVETVPVDLTPPPTSIPEALPPPQGIPPPPSNPTSTSTVSTPPQPADLTSTSPLNPTPPPPPPAPTPPSPTPNSTSTTAAATAMTTTTSATATPSSPTPVTASAPAQVTAPPVAQEPVEAPKQKRGFFERMFSSKPAPPVKTVFVGHQQPATTTASAGGGPSTAKAPSPSTALEPEGNTVSTISTSSSGPGSATMPQDGPPPVPAPHISGSGFGLDGEVGPVAATTSGSDPQDSLPPTTTAQQQPGPSFGLDAEIGAAGSRLPTSGSIPQESLPPTATGSTSKAPALAVTTTPVTAQPKEEFGLAAETASGTADPTAPLATAGTAHLSTPLTPPSSAPPTSGLDSEIHQQPGASFGLDAEISAAGSRLPLAPIQSAVSPEKPRAGARHPMTPEKEANVKTGIVAMLQSGRLPTSPGGGSRLLSKQDVLSVRIHATSALVPSPVLVSPVIRVHLMDGEMGTYLKPSGMDSTPLQTAPFDLSRRVKNAFAAEWNETLDVEEELGGIINPNAVLLFELLQPPPSFSSYEERRGLFPSGQHARVAWGFLKLIRSRDGQPNLGRLQLQLYKYDDAMPGVRVPTGTTSRPTSPRGMDPRQPQSSLAPGSSGMQSQMVGFGSPRTGGPPAVWYAWKGTVRLPATRRQLYPGHVSVTLAPAVRRHAATSLLASTDGISTRGLLSLTPPRQDPRQQDTAEPGSPSELGRPSRRERIERERSLGGGWRTAEQRLAAAPAEDMVEVTQSLGRIPYETMVYGMDAETAHAHAVAALGMGGGTPMIGARAAMGDPEMPMSPALAVALRGVKAEEGGGLELTAAKLPYARETHDECEIPNAPARTQPAVPATVSECLLVSFDPAGQRMAVVCKEGSMHTLRVFDVATGAPLVSFPGHGAAVYDLAWAPRGVVGAVEAPPTHVMTASADGAARAWAVGSGANPRGADDMVVQHACECYAAAWHPVAPGVTATAARDGGIRLWRMPRKAGELAMTGYAAATPTSQEAWTLTGAAPSAGVAATALAFDSGGYRLFVGFADGVVRELQVELGQDAGVGLRGPESGGLASELGLAHMMTGKVTAANSSLRPLRECKDTMGEPITCIRVTPNDRRILVRTLADRIAAVDIGFFAATHSFDCSSSTRGSGPRKTSTAETVRTAAKTHPLMRCAVSPDGRWLVAGTSERTVRLFDVDVAGPGVRVPGADAGAVGAGINDVAWSPAAHVIAIAPVRGGQPLRVLAKIEGAPPVSPPSRPHMAVLKGPGGAEFTKETRAAAGFGRRLRAELPPRLTPEAVREMLNRVRVEAQRDRSELSKHYQRTRGEHAQTPRAQGASARFAAYQATAGKENWSSGGGGGRGDTRGAGLESLFAPSRSPRGGFGLDAEVGASPAPRASPGVVKSQQGGFGLDAEVGASPAPRASSGDKHYGLDGRSSVGSQGATATGYGLDEETKVRTSSGARASGAAVAGLSPVETRAGGGLGSLVK